MKSDSKIIKEVRWNQLISFSIPCVSKKSKVALPSKLGLFRAKSEDFRILEAEKMH
jgi:hypothetical protein